MDNQNIISNEKNKSLTWIVFNILLRQTLFLIPLYFAFIYSLGYSMKYGILPDISSSEDIEAIMFYLGIFLFLISLIGVWWGCKYVAKSASIQDGDLTKIGYWVGLIPFVVVGVMGSGMLVGAGVFGIFTTPRYIKKWLVKYRDSK